jgi:DNA-binding transcriptional MerR regulator
MDNKDNEFLSIKEFAAIVGMTAETLRHYDRNGVFRPAVHGVEFENKYRFYSPPQIITVKMIRVLVEIGVPLQEIKELAISRTPEQLLKLLTKHKRKSADEISFLQEVFSIVGTFLELLKVCRKWLDAGGLPETDDGVK